MYMFKLLLAFLLISNIACADTKITGLPVVSSNNATDITVTVTNPNSAPVTKNIQWGNVTVGKATALAATPTQCNAGYFPLGIDTSGNAQNCTLSGSGGGGNPGGISTQVQINNSGVFAGSNLYVVGSNFGVNNAAPAYTFDVNGIGNFSTSLRTPAISNLTLNGFVKTSLANGTLSVDTNAYLTGNQNITLSGILSGSGTTSILASAASGYYMPLTSDQTNWNSKQLNLNLAPGTYINGDLCTYSSSGTLLNCNTALGGTGTVTSIATTAPLTGGTITSTGTLGITQATTSANGYLSSTDWNTFNGKGSGSVTSVSVVSANGITGTVASSTTTPAITLTPFLKMSGINWSDSFNNTTGVNWYQVPVTTQSVSTTGTGVGLLQFFNAARSFFFNQSINSGISASYGINWPAIAPTTGQIPEVVDGLGDINWVSVSSISGPTNWAQLQGNPNAINWTTYPNTLAAGHGINWADLYNNYQSPVNWTAPMSSPQFTANGSGSAIVGVGICTSHTGVMSCIGTSGCMGYVTAFTSFNSLTCVCC